MTQIHLNGEGFPIPTEALPDGIVDGDTAPLTFVLIEDWDKTDWVGLGYTHYEVMCVGAAGGRGGMGFWYTGGNQAKKAYSYGGGGGGGGMHIVSGLLADLDDISAVVVGQAGENGADEPFTAWVRSIHDWEIYDAPGEDGGFSSFADDICQASGGKGGENSPVIATDSGSLYIPPYLTSNQAGGIGGEGGIGGQTTAGGGAEAGETGSWDGTIGEGGGGGLGGTMQLELSNFAFRSIAMPGHGAFSYTRFTAFEGGNGGQGSFSYADPSQYGQRGYRAAAPIAPGLQSGLIIPGGGGGGRPIPLAKYGSNSPGYSPNGVVIIRIFKVIPPP